MVDFFGINDYAAKGMCIKDSKSKWWYAVHAVTMGGLGAVMPLPAFQPHTAVGCAFLCAIVAWMMTCGTSITNESVLLTFVHFLIAFCILVPADAAAIWACTAVYAWEVLETRALNSPEEVHDTVLDIAIGLFSFSLCYAASSGTAIDRLVAPAQAAYACVGLGLGCVVGHQESNHLENTEILHGAAVVAELIRVRFNRLFPLQHVCNLATFSTGVGLSLFAWHMRRSRTPNPKT